MSLEENSAVEAPGQEREDAAAGETRGPEHSEERAESPQRDLIREEIALALERLQPQPARQAESESAAESVEALKQALEASRREAAELKEEASRLRKDRFLRQTLSALGVENLDLAVKAVKEDIVETGDRQWVAAGDSGEVPAQQYLAEFLRQNRELLPARRLQGSGMTATRIESAGGVDIEEIRPGMDPATVRKVRDAIGRAMGVFPRGS